MRFRGQNHGAISGPQRRADKTAYFVHQKAVVFVELNGMRLVIAFTQGGKRLIDIHHFCGPGFRQLKLVHGSPPNDTAIKHAS